MSFLRKTWRRWLVALISLLVLGWALIPGWRAITLVANQSGRGAPGKPADLPVQDVHFEATDGVKLAGWLLIASPQKPTIILVHGWKGSRVQTLSWARFLYEAGYNVLLYDSRGCGESDGWGITVGAREPEDVLGAIRYLKTRSDLTNKQFGAYGFSLGAGVVIIAAAREPALLATISDSGWIDNSAQIERMSNLNGIPLLPYELPLVDSMVGARLADVQPLAVINTIAPRAVMLIHSADDQNDTTPPAGSQQLYQAAKEPKELWIAPSGGHTGALAAHPEDYKQHVLSFFAAHFPNSL